MNTESLRDQLVGLWADIHRESFKIDANARHQERYLALPAKRMDEVLSALSTAVDARLRAAVEGLLHTIATQVPRDAAFSFMLTRDVAEVSRALVTLPPSRGTGLRGDR